MGKEIYRFKPQVRHTSYRPQKVHAVRWTRYGWQAYCGRMISGEEAMTDLGKWEETKEPLSCKVCIVAMRDKRG